jgi:hypothetical protein
MDIPSYVALVRADLLDDAYKVLLEFLFSERNRTACFVLRAVAICIWGGIVSRNQRKG